MPTSPRLFLIFNHEFTPSQKSDARSALGVEHILTMPEAVAKCWGSVPPEAAAIRDFLTPVRSWLLNHAKRSDYVLIQGDFGACFLLVNFAFENGWVPIYATTRREALEEPQSDGSIRMIHRFKHQRFRLYEQ